MTILQTKSEQAIFTKSRDATYSEAFQRGPLLPVRVKISLNVDNDSASAVVHIQSSQGGATFTPCAKAILSKSEPKETFIITNTDTYIRAYIESVSGGSVDVLFDAME